HDGGCSRFRDSAAKPERSRGGSCSVALSGISGNGRCRVLPRLYSIVAGWRGNPRAQRTAHLCRCRQDPKGRHRAAVARRCRMNPASINTISTGGLRTVCALYMRVSTKGHGQTTDTQALALREYAQRRGFEIVAEYRDEGISGSKDSRPALD